MFPSLAACPNRQVRTTRSTDVAAMAESASCVQELNLTNPLISLSEQVASTVAEAGRSVVAIHARPRFDSSGVHWSPGVVVTADHTIRRDEDIHITTSA